MTVGGGSKAAGRRSSSGVRQEAGVVGGKRMPLVIVLEADGEVKLVDLPREDYEQPEMRYVVLISLFEGAMKDGACGARRTTRHVRPAGWPLADRPDERAARLTDGGRGGRGGARGGGGRACSALPPAPQAGGCWDLPALHTPACCPRCPPPLPRRKDRGAIFFWRLTYHTV